MHLRRIGAVSGDADEAHETFLPGPHQRSQGTVGGHCPLPARLIGEVVQLDEVHLIHLHA